MQKESQSNDFSFSTGDMVTLKHLETKIGTREYERFMFCVLRETHNIKFSIKQNIFESDGLVRFYSGTKSFSNYDIFIISKIDPQLKLIEEVDLHQPDKIFDVSGYIKDVCEIVDPKTGEIFIISKRNLNFLET